MIMVRRVNKLLPLWMMMMMMMMEPPPPPMTLFIRSPPLAADSHVHGLTVSATRHRPLTPGIRSSVGLCLGDVSHLSLRIVTFGSRSARLINRADESLDGTAAFHISWRETFKGL